MLDDVSQHGPWLLPAVAEVFHAIERSRCARVLGESTFRDNKIIQICLDLT